MGGNEATPRERPSADALDASVRLARLRRQMFSRVVQTRIAQYQVLRQIGGGGMGLVFAALDPSLDRMIAIKVLREQSPTTSRVLRREALALAKLRHPNVVSVFEVGEHEGRMYLAMEFVEGQTLRPWLSAWRAGPRRQRDLPALLEVFRQAAEGLAAAHAAGLVHRDIKPDNLMIDEHGRVRLMDFGLARADASGDPTPDESAPDESAPDLRGRGLSTEYSHGLFGTPAYMAPEQLRGEPPTPAADQFALCVCLCEALYGRRPRDEDTADARIEVPSERGVPRPLRAILRRGLALDPADRFPNMSQLAQALAQQLRPARRWLVAGGLAVALVGVVSGAALVTRDRSAPCEADLAGTWDATTRATLTSHFAEIGGAEGAKLWPRVEARIDDYARAWSEKFESSCRARFVAHEDSEAVYDLRMRCLQRRRNRLDAAIETLREVADGTELRARLAVAFRLPALAPCDDVDALRDREPLPDDPDLRARIERVRADLDRAEAIWDAGEYRPALEISVAAERQAREIGYLPLVSEALVMIGRSQGAGAGTPPELEATARETILVAAEAGDARSEAIAWTELLMALTLQDREVEAHQQELAATAAVARADDDVVRGWLYNNLGGLYSDLGDVEGALEHFRRALEIKRATLGPDHFDVAITAYNFANALYLASRFDEARGPMSEARELARSTVGETHPVYLVSTYGLCRVELWDDNDATALPLCAEAAAGLEAIDMPLFSGNAAFYLGRAQWALGDRAEALQTVHHALELAEGRDPKAAQDIRDWLADPD